MAGSLCPKYLMERCINEIGLKDLSINYDWTLSNNACYKYKWYYWKENYKCCNFIPSYSL
jgi:hypothetical protein